MRHDYSLTQSTRGGRPRRPLEIAMTPMIDVIFLLLVFFLATSSFQLVEKMLPASVSKTAEQLGGGTESPTEPTDDAVEQIVIKLETRNGQTIATMNGVALTDWTELESRLQAIRLARADVPVIIDPAADVTAAVVVKAYDWSRLAGLSRVYLATGR